MPLGCRDLPPGGDGSQKCERIVLPVKPNSIGIPGNYSKQSGDQGKESCYYPGEQLVLFFPQHTGMPNKSQSEKGEQVKCHGGFQQAGNRKQNSTENELTISPAVQVTNVLPPSAKYKSQCRRVCQKVIPVIGHYRRNKNEQGNESSCHEVFQKVLCNPEQRTQTCQKYCCVDNAVNVIMGSKYFIEQGYQVIQQGGFSRGISSGEIVGRKAVNLGLKKFHSMLIKVQCDRSTVGLPPTMNRLWGAEKNDVIIVNYGNCENRGIEKQKRILFGS